MANRLHWEFGALRTVANDPKLQKVMLTAVQGSAQNAKALTGGKEFYRTNVQSGRFRSYARAWGQAPGTGGYWRGKQVQALWHSRPSI